VIYHPAGHAPRTRHGLQVERIYYQITTTPAAVVDVDYRCVIKLGVVICIFSRERPRPIGDYRPVVSRV